MPRKKANKEPSPLDEIRQETIGVWEDIGNYKLPSPEDLTKVVRELRAEREEYKVKEAEKEAKK